MPQILGIYVIFSLPTWIGKYDYYKEHYYSENHQWAGQVNKETYENEVLDRLWEELEWDEACHNMSGPWVKLRVTGALVAGVPTNIYKLQAKVATILAEFEEKGRG